MFGFSQFATHLLVFALGVCTWLPFTIWEGKRLTRGENVEHHHTAKHSQTWRNGVTAALILSVLFVALGVQQIMYQRDADDRDTCAETWSTEVITVLETRVTANDEVAAATRKRDRAERSRDNSVDSVLLLVRALQRQDPPPAPEEQQRRFEVALQRFFEARELLTARQAVLDEAQTKAEATKKNNPYPDYDCGG